MVPGVAQLDDRRHFDSSVALLLASFSRLRKKSVDLRFGAPHRVAHIRNPLILRDQDSRVGPISWPFFPNRDFFRSLLVLLRQ